MRRLWLLLPTALTTLAATRTASAQVNVEVYRTVLKTTAYAGMVEGALDGKTGNSRGLDVTADGRLAGKHGRSRALLYGSLEYGKFNETLSAEKSFVHARYGFVIDDVIMLEAFFQLQNDQLQRLSYRELYGAGPHFTLYDDGTVTLAAGQYVMAEHERINVPAGATDPPTENTIRGSTLATMSLAIDDRITGSFALYYQPRLDDFADYRFLADGGFVFTITKRLASKIMMTVRHDSRPPTSIYPTDTELKSALALTF